MSLLYTLLLVRAQFLFCHSVATDSDTFFCFPLLCIILCCFPLGNASLRRNTCAVQLNGHRCIEGTLRGYDQFINLTLADVVDKTVTGTSAASNRDLGMVVRYLLPTQDWTRGLWCRVCALVNHADVVFLT